MPAVRRFDRGELSKPVRLPNGFLKVDAYLTRVGVFEYRLPDGKIRRELRPPDEVFHPDSLASFAQAPVTNDHPLPGYLTSENAHQFTRGSVGEPRADGDKVRASLMVWGPDAIADLGKGKTQVSCGYSAEMDETPGVWNGQRYDSVQRVIRGNHVAIVATGRAGPDVRVRMDNADAMSVDSGPFQIPTDSTEQRVPTKQIKIDEVEVTVDETVAQLIEKQQAKNDAAVAAALADGEKGKAERDGLKAKLDAAEAQLKEAPAKIRAQIDSRVALESKAREVLGEQKVDALSDRQVRCAVLAKVTPTFKADDKSDAYVEARFDAALELWRKENPGQDALRALVTDAGKTDTSSLSVEEAEARFRKLSSEAYRTRK